MTANQVGVTLYIGEDIYDKLSEDDQETFDTIERYKPDAIVEQMSESDGEWEDPAEVFKNIQDYEDFWGDDFSNTGGIVYEKYFDLEEDHDQYGSQLRSLKDLSDQVKEEGYGNQLRIEKVYKLSWIIKKTSEGILIPIQYFNEDYQVEDGQEYELKLEKNKIRLLKLDDDD